jgi:hypothetical protein
MASKNKNGWEFVDDFEAIEHALESELGAAVVRVGKKVLVQAAKKAPKDTTALSKSGAIRGEGVDTESDAQNAAQSANPELTWDGFENITNTPGIASVEIGFGADYAVPVHNGHMSGKTFVSPRPFFSNALNANDELLNDEGEKALEKAFKKAKQS